MTYPWGNAFFIKNGPGDLFNGYQGDHLPRVQSELCDNFRAMLEKIVFITVVSYNRPEL